MAEEVRTINGIPVDPRVEWAMKVMDREGHDFEREFDKILYPGSMGLAPISLIAFYNLLNKMPVKRNILAGVALSPITFYLGIQAKRWRESIQAENRAMVQHYILTHPERFPEPPRVKYADMICEWRRDRL
eukprot:TRINITY_DN790_c0_g2_i1.p1 TRINITY_DN790_c0_g2~~TRINITY_DN790_c0_g2_i1.p1  ORF type:complete len:141 (+),score=36.58 TRINITY_DN790_c0_g2_i1:32-424(+)